MTHPAHNDTTLSNFAYNPNGARSGIVLSFEFVILAFMGSESIRSRSRSRSRLREVGVGVGVGVTKKPADSAALPIPTCITPMLYNTWLIMAALEVPVFTP